MGRFEEMIHGLQEEIEVPEQVWEKYTDTFSHLTDAGQKYSHRGIRKNVWIAAAAAVLAVGAVSVGAAEYMKWSRSLGEGLQINSEQREALVDNQMASYIGQSVTQGDVTVTVQDCIVDNYCAFISLKVEGYQLEDGKTPGFAYCDAEVDEGGDDNYSGGYSAGFYDGLIWGENDKPVHADGTPLADDEWGSYVMEDGSLEFQFAMNRDKKDYFVGRPIHVELRDLGFYKEKAGDIEVEAEGTWSFDWTLPGNDMGKTYVLNAPLGDSGAAIQQVELSPLSANLLYEFPKQEETEIGIDADGKEFVHTTYVEPPYFAGVRMKDGTIYRLSGGGTMGYTEDDPDIYRHMTTFDRVIDVEQVESILFIKSYPEGEEALTEENYYIVPLE